MAEITRGFVGVRRDDAEDLPPGQYLAHDFPVLSIGPTPRVEHDEWAFSITAETGLTTSWTWDELSELPIEDVHTDIHCVTRWSKLGTNWRGVALDTLFTDVDTAYAYAMVHSYDGYTTNVPLSDLLGGRAWLALEYEGKPLAPEHGGPVRLIVPHLYFWKSAKWARGLVLHKHNDPGFWEQNGYHIRADPWLEERYS